MRKLWFIMLIVSALAVGGCSMLRYATYIINPSSGMKSVDAEHDLAGKTVAVVIYAGLETRLDYQNVQIEIFDAVSAEMKRNIKRVKLIDPRRVIRYQAENPDWNSEPPEKLCRVFGADAVLLISLIEFTSREPGSVHLARGRITAEARVYEPPKPGPDAAPGGCAWRSKTLRVIYPADTPVGLPIGNDWELRMTTEKIFATQLVRSFYKHKVPRES